MGAELEQPLIGIDPDDTVEVKVLGARFTIGIIEHGVWARLSNEIDLAYQLGKRRAIKQLDDAGIAPSEVAHVLPAVDGKEERRVTQVEIATVSEPGYRERLNRAMAEVVRHSVRGHAGFVRRDMTEIPFTTETRKHEGLELAVVGAETMRWYTANPTVLNAVYAAARRLQELGATEKKD